MLIVSFLDTEMAQVVEIFPYGRQGPFILHVHHNGCWCPGSLRRQVISSRGIDLTIPVYPDCSTRKVNFTCLCCLLHASPGPSFIILCRMSNVLYCFYRWYMRYMFYIYIYIYIQFTNRKTYASRRVNFFQTNFAICENNNHTHQYVT